MITYMKIFILGLLLLSPAASMATQVYHFVPGYYQIVNHDPTNAFADLGIVSQPTAWTIPVGAEACYAWQMGSLTKDVGSGSFGWATGFFPPIGNQIQSFQTDSGFQNYGDERGIYIATQNRSTDGVLDIQCGKYYGQQQAFYPWDYGSNAILKHGVTVKMPKAWHSNPADQKFYAVMYLRISERDAHWPNPQNPEKGFWLQVRIADGRGPGVFPYSQGYAVFEDIFTDHPVIDIEKSNKSGLIWSNANSMQITEWNDYKYFEYTINRSQIIEIVNMVNVIQEPGKAITTNPDDLMVFAIGTSPEVHVIGTEQSVVGFSFKWQYVRTEY